jgi:hypothetical protein
MEDFPTDLIRVIMSFLSLWDFTKIRRVSRRCHKICQSSPDKMALIDLLNFYWKNMKMGGTYMAIKLWDFKIFETFVIYNPKSTDMEIINYIIDHNMTPFLQLLCDYEDVHIAEHIEEIIYSAARGYRIPILKMLELEGYAFYGIGSSGHDGAQAGNHEDLIQYYAEGFNDRKLKDLFPD